MLGRIRAAIRISEVPTDSCMDWQEGKGGAELARDDGANIQRGLDHGKMLNIANRSWESMHGCDGDACRSCLNKKRKSYTHAHTIPDSFISLIAIMRTWSPPRRWKDRVMWPNS